MPTPIFFIVLFPLTLALEIYFYRAIRSGREPVKEIVFKMIGSHFYLFYVAHRIFSKIGDYQRYPDKFSVFSWINWGLVIATFLLFFISYLIRKPPVVPAKNFRERFFPFLCAPLPFLIYESPRWFSQEVQGQWNVPSMALILMGNVIIVCGLFYLRYCFSITTQARAHVKHGIYRWVRHPMYLGQSLATIGSCLWLPSWFNIGITILFVFLQRLRAYFEEVKLTQAFPSYADYKKKTGAYFPRVT